MGFPYSWRLVSCGSFTISFRLKSRQIILISQYRTDEQMLEVLEVELGSDFPLKRGLSRLIETEGTIRGGAKHHKVYNGLYCVRRSDRAYPYEVTQHAERLVLLQARRRLSGTPTRRRAGIWQQYAFTDSFRVSRSTGRPGYYSPKGVEH